MLLTTSVADLIEGIGNNGMFETVTSLDKLQGGWILGVDSKTCGASKYSTGDSTWSGDVGEGTTAYWGPLLGYSGA